MTGAAKNTVTKLLVDLGKACSEYQDATVRGLTSTRVELDEIWAYVYAKDKNLPERMQNERGVGSVWTWTAICATSKLVPSWLVGERSPQDAYAFVNDLASRLAQRIQLSTDGNRLCLTAVEDAFGSNVDYAMIQKLYGADPEPQKRYSPAKCIGVEVNTVMGDPDSRLVSTSYVERQNLTMRMGMRRFTRLTNAFSKKAENLAHAVGLHFMHYNFARPHKMLSRPYPTTPAMAAGKADHVWTLREIAELLRR